MCHTRLLVRYCLLENITDKDDCPVITYEGLRKLDSYLRLARNGRSIHFLALVETTEVW
jgi:hypothetical protein